jgi:GTPase-activating protein SAC7
MPTSTSPSRMPLGILRYTDESPLSSRNAASSSRRRVKIPTLTAWVLKARKATDVEGIFRVSGSAKRIKELQAYFDSPPTYGKSLEWDGFNVHDAANVFRRYINHLPEPIIPYDYYFAFRKPLGSTLHKPSSLTDAEKENPDTEETIKEYQRLIGDLPRLNGQLLLYILDLLAVFAETSALNLMPAANLAAIFQPGLLSHPDHDMNPQEYRVSQEVLIFLIQHQDRFLPTTAQRPPAPSQPQQQPSPPTPQPPKQPPTSTQPKPTSKAANQPPGPPAKYSGVYPPKESETPNPRRLSKNTSSPEQKPGWGGKLRRNQSSRTPQSPKLGVEQEEPRRLSEGSERASAMPAPIEEDESLTTTRSGRTEDQPEATPTPAAKDGK